ncbi:hypothetical protein BHM03_00024609 [Ensete ventricosum]|nr:hypothetical protein BHM03_00024609 [Ensete ventricosum]
MSSERPFGDSSTEHHPEPDHPRPTEEATAAVPTPNRFWRMMTDPGFPSLASNPASFMVTAKAFLGLTNQVQALAGMVQTIIPYLPKLMHLMAHQLAPPVARPQTESSVAPNRETPPDVEAPQPQVAEARPASPTPTPARSQSSSNNPVPTEPDFDTLSTDTIDSLREQVRRVHQQLDKVQKEVLKSREEVGESSKSDSPFTPEIQAKPLPATFRLPALEPYDGSGDPTEHIATFRAQMTLYDTSEALMCRAFPTTLRGSARTCLPPGDGPRERRAPLPVRGTVHIAGPGNPRPPFIPGHPSILDRAEAVKILLAFFKAERLLVLDDRLPRQLGSGALQVLHGLQQLVVHPPSPGSRLPQQLLGVAQVAPNLLQFLLRGLAPEELLVSLPLGLLELLPQLGCAPFGLGNRLWSPSRFQSVKLFL